MEMLQAKLDYLADTKEAIKNAIISKEVEVADDVTFREYADKISEIMPLEIKDMSYFFESDRRKDQMLELLSKLSKTAENMNYMFYKCTTVTDASGFKVILDGLEEIDMSGCISADRMFSGLSTMQRAPELKNIEKLETASYMCYGCSTLTLLPTSAFPVATKLNYVYANCKMLGVVNDFSAPECDDISFGFQECSGLTKVDGFSVPKATTVSSIFYKCSALKEVLNLDISAGASPGNIFLSTALERLTFAPEATRVPSFSIAQRSFNRANMIEMFNSLPAGGDSTITITGNPCLTDTENPLTAEDIAIATAKGYTITT